MTRRRGQPATVKPEGSTRDARDLETPAACWAHCPRCRRDFRLGVSVPCALDLYIAALRLARCPTCGARASTLLAYSPGQTPRRIKVTPGSTPRRRSGPA